jgi:hypothetical protein
MSGLAPRCVALVRHPSSPDGVVRRIDVEIASTPNGGLRLRYFLDGDVTGIIVPQPAVGEHTDGLWGHTCFEAFVAGHDSAAYCEFNFSPSTHWAVYGFSRYREGMAPLDYATDPLVAASVTDDRIALEALIPLEALLALPGDGTLRLALAAVIEMTDGSLSYWALAHPAEAPDFHHPDSFVLSIDRESTW